MRRETVSERRGRPPENLFRYDAMESQNVCDAISAEVARRAKDWYGPGSVVTGPVARVETRRYSFFLRFLVRDEAGEANQVLVKIPRRPEIGSLALAATEPRSPGAIREYESLLAIDRVVKESNEHELRSIRPLGFLDPWNAFAMEHVEGQTLKQIVTSPKILVAARTDWDRLARIFHSAGRWLASFHDHLGGARGGAPDTITMNRTVTEVLDSLERSTSDEVELGAIRDAFERFFDEMPAAADRTTVLHSDFMSANILVTPDERVVVLDTHRAETGSIYEDIARLAMDLPTLKAQVLSRGRVYRETGLRACREALFRGYFEARPRDRALTAFHSALVVVRKWCFDEARIVQSRRLPELAKRRAAAWIRPYFRDLTLRSLSV